MASIYNSMNEPPEDDDKAWDGKKMKSLIPPLYSPLYMRNQEADILTPRRLQEGKTHAERALEGKPFGTINPHSVPEDWQLGKKDFYPGKGKYKTNPDEDLHPGAYGPKNADLLTLLNKDFTPLSERTTDWPSEENQWGAHGGEEMILFDGLRIDTTKQASGVQAKRDAAILNAYMKDKKLSSTGGYLDKNGVLRDKDRNMMMRQLNFKYDSHADDAGYRNYSKNEQNRKDGNTTWDKDVRAVKGYARNLYDSMFGTDKKEEK